MLRFADVVVRKLQHEVHPTPSGWNSGSCVTQTLRASFNPCRLLFQSLKKNFDNNKIIVEYISVLVAANIAEKFCNLIRSHNP